MPGRWTFKLELGDIIMAGIWIALGFLVGFWFNRITKGHRGEFVYSFDDLRFWKYYRILQPSTHAKGVYLVEAISPLPSPFWVALPGFDVVTLPKESTIFSTGDTWYGKRRRYVKFLN